MNLQKIKEVLPQIETVTQNTAIQIFPYFGKNQKNHADHMAVEEMRKELNRLPFVSKIILGEGEKDNAPMLYEGEELGSGEHLFDLVVDPLECTTNFARGLPNSMSIVAFAEKGHLAKVPGTYMEQWIAGPRMKARFRPDIPLKDNMETLGSYLDKTLSELLIVVQDRPRHEKLIQDLRNLGCGVVLIDSGSITATLDVCLQKGHYDAMIGTFGAPEGLVSAIIAKCTGSEMKGILRPHEEKYKELWASEGFADGQILDKADFVNTPHCGFVGTCISSNIVMKGITRHHHILHGNSLTLFERGMMIHEWESKLDGL